MRKFTDLFSKVFKLKHQEDDLIGRCCWNCRYRLYDKVKEPCCICNMGSEWEIDD